MSTRGVKRVASRRILLPTAAGALLALAGCASSAQVKSADEPGMQQAQAPTSNGERIARVRPDLSTGNLTPVPGAPQECSAPQADQALASLEALTDEVCSCAEPVCLLRVDAKLEQFAQDFSDLGDGVALHREQFESLAQRMIACRAMAAHLVASEHDDE